MYLSQHIFHIYGVLQGTQLAICHTKQTSLVNRAITSAVIWKVHARVLVSVEILSICQLELGYQDISKHCYAM